MDKYSKKLWNKKMEEVAETIGIWLPYIVNSFIDKRFSNGYTKGVNKIKVIKKNRLWI